MPKGRTKKIAPEEEERIIQEVEAKSKEVTDLLGKLSFYRGEALIYKALREVDYHDQKIATVGVAYFVPTDEAFEVRIADELHRRLGDAVSEWKDWVQKELRPDEKTPF